MFADIQITLPYSDFQNIVNSRRSLDEKVDRIKKAICLYETKASNGHDTKEDLLLFYLDVKKAVIGDIYE